MLQHETVWRAFEAAALGHPAKELLVVDDHRYTYRQIQRLAEGLARSLVQNGVRPGDLVALWLHNSLEWVVTLLAAARIGAPTFGVSTRLRHDEVAYLLHQSRAKVLFVSHLPGSQDFVELTYALLPELKAATGYVHSDRFPSLRTVICTDPAPRPGMLIWQKLAGVEPDPLSDVAPSPEDVAVVQYTSGSTARPKGALLTHGAITRNARLFGDRMGIVEEDRFFSGNPSFHVAAVVTSLMNVITHRATYVTMKRYEAGAALELLERERCTARNGMDTMFQREMAHPDFPRRRLALRKGTMMGAGRVLRAAAERMGMAGIVSLYSLSEASGNATSTDPSDPLDVRATTVGRPLPGVDVRLADPDTGSTVGPDGEILLRGWTLMRGYHNDPRATAQAIDPDGWLHTGDLGRLDPNGRLVFVGRLKDIVRVGGENVSSAEVEEVLMSHPAVEVAQVVPAPDDDLDEVPVAFVELVSNAACTAEALADFCSGRLARFKIPRRIWFTSDWPTTASGKIRKADLAQRAGNLMAGPHIR